MGAIRVQRGSMRLRAQSGNMNLPGQDPRAYQLIAVGEPEIHIRTSGASGVKPAGQRIVAVARSSKRVHDLRADFAATWTQARPDGGQQIGRSGSERVLHRTHGRPGGTLDSASPAGMHRTHNPETGIGQENRGAVGHSHTNCAGGIITDDGIGFGAVPLRRAHGSRDRHIGAMHLANQQQPAGDHTERAGYSLPGGIAGGQMEICSREEMVHDVEQWAGAKHRAPRRLRPIEPVVRLRQAHGHSRTWVRRD